MLQVRNFVTADHVVNLLNLVPPDPADYARLLTAYWRACYPHATPRRIAGFSADLQEWLERQTSTGHAAFVQNYLASAVTLDIPAAKWRKADLPPRTIPRELRYTVGDALVSAYLRTLVDQWLATGRDAEGRERYKNRHWGKASNVWLVVQEFLEQNPPSLYPESDSGVFRLTVAEVDWKSKAGNFFTTQKTRAERLLVGILASDWQSRLCKCRYAPCGRYYIAVKMRQSYRRGTYCSPQHRAAESAKALTRKRRDESKWKLVDVAAQWLKTQGCGSRCLDDAAWKERVVGVLGRAIFRYRHLRLRSKSLTIKWVTRNRFAIEKRLEVLREKGA